VTTEPPIGERLAAIERDVVHLLDESRAIRNTLHSLIATALGDHSAAIRALSAAHDQKIGIWWTIAWISAGLLVVIGGLAWLLEHQVEIVVKP
jgi:hypothetical protein